MTKKPRRVDRCTTHHAGCACREWQYEQMAMALRIIRTWAVCDGSSLELRSKAMADIVAKCDEALGKQLSPKGLTC